MTPEVDFRLEAVSAVSTEAFLDFHVDVSAPAGAA